MKILMLTDSMENGGAETHIYELSRSLLRLGHRVTVLSRGGAMAERLKAEGIRHVDVPTLSARGWGLLPSLRAVLTAVCEEKPSLIHAHTRQTAFLCRLLSPFLGVPAVFTAHARFHEGGAGELLRLFRGQIIAVSEDVRAHLTCAFGMRQERITVIGNGIDTARFFPAEKPPRKELRILTVSRLDKDCALAATLLCRLLPALRERFPVRLTVVGGGDALPALRTLAEREEGIHLVGAQGNVRPYLAECDVFVGVSRAALEAMAMEKPVILCGNEGYLGILNEKSMALAEESNFCARGQALPTEEALGKDLVALLEATEAHRAHLGSLCREAVLARHTADEMAHQTLDVYRQALRDCRACDLFLCGYYGYGNLGDELVLRALVEGLHARIPDLKIAALMGRGEAPEGTLRVSRFRPLALIRTLRRSGAVLLGGGTLLQSATSRRSLSYYLSIIALARYFGIPFGMLAGGVGPFRSERDKKRCADLLRGAEFLGLRDAASFALLTQMGQQSERLHLGADPVLTLPLPDLTPDARFLTVFPRKGDERNAEFLEGIVGIARAHSLPVCVAAMDGSEDTDTAARLVGALGEHGICAESCPPLNYLRLCALLSSSALVLSRRLHALILACRIGVPVLAVSDDPKLHAFLCEVYPRDLADRLSLSPTRLQASELIAYADYALARQERLRALAEARIPLLAARAEEQLALLVEKTLKY